MNPDPKLRDPIFLFLVAVFLGSLASGMDMWAGWLRLSLAGGVWVFFGAGLISLLNWIAFMAAARIRETTRAMIAGKESLAFALKGLTPQQTKMVAEHDIINIIGTTNNDGITWNIKALNGEYIPWDFMEDFLKQSLETPRDERAQFGYLWPVREHHVFDWPNSEELCTNATSLLIHSPKGFARKAAGPYPALLEQSVELIAAYFGVEV